MFEVKVKRITGMMMRRKAAVSNVENRIETKLKFRGIVLFSQGFELFSCMVKYCAHLRDYIRINVRNTYVINIVARVVAFEVQILLVLLLRLLT